MVVDEFAVARLRPHPRIPKAAAGTSTGARRRTPNGAIGCRYLHHRDSSDVSGGGIRLEFDFVLCVHARNRHCAVPGDKVRASGSAARN